jgi:hypothetical protein
MFGSTGWVARHLTFAESIWRRNDRLPIAAHVQRTILQECNHDAPATNKPAIKTASKNSRMVMSLTQWQVGRVSIDQRACALICVNHLGDVLRCSCGKHLYEAVAD